MSVRPIPFVLLLIVALAVGAAVGCRDAEPDAASGRAAAVPAPAGDAGAAEDGEARHGGLSGDADSLLQFAFAAASRLPDLHEKTRCRLQEDVILACLAADRAELAATLAPPISNWRHGAALAAIAQHHAERDEIEPAERALAAAIAVADAMDRAATEQQWRWDRVRAGIAATLIALGRPADAARYETALDVSQLTPLVVGRAERLSAADLADRIGELERAVAQGDFDVTRSAYAAAAVLYGRFYDRRDDRDRIEALLRGSITKVPMEVGITVLSELAQRAIDHQDNVKALELLADARALAARRSWELRHGLPMRAGLAELRWKAGDREAALAEARAALEAWRSEGQSVVDIWRAGAVRPLAAAFHTMGETAVADELYGVAAEQSVVNPNSVPRVEDLVGNVLSMVLIGHTPTASLRVRLVEIRDGLGDPW